MAKKKNKSSKRTKTRSVKKIVKTSATSSGLPEKKETNKKVNALGISSNVAGALCYPLSFITGAIFLIIQPDNKSVQFHAMQSILLGAAWLVVTVVLFILLRERAVQSGVNLVMGIVSLWCMWQAYEGKLVKLPLIGEMSEKMNR